MKTGIVFRIAHAFRLLLDKIAILYFVSNLVPCMYLYSFLILHEVYSPRRRSVKVIDICHAMLLLLFHVVRDNFSKENLINHLYHTF